MARTSCCRRTSRLWRPTRQQRAEKGADQGGLFKIIVLSGSVSDQHVKALEAAGFPVEHIGEHAIVDALQQRIPDFDPTGLRPPVVGQLVGLPGYIGNVLSHLGEPLGAEGRHGYKAWRGLVDWALAGGDSAVLLETLDQLQSEIQAGGAESGPSNERHLQAVREALNHHEAMLAMLDLVESRLRAEQEQERPQAAAAAAAQADSTPPPAQDTASPRRGRILLGMLGKCDEGVLCDTLGVPLDQLKTVRRVGPWEEKQAGTTDWYVVGRDGAEDAMLLYDATDEKPDETIDEVKRVVGRSRMAKGRCESSWLAIRMTRNTND